MIQISRAMRQVMRTIAAVACALAAWVVAAPAWAASAGLCGQNGSSEVAPTPIFMPSQASLEEGDVGYCAAEWDQETVQRGDERSEATPPAPEALLPSMSSVCRAGVASATDHPETEPAPSGVVSTLERPPRRF